VLRHHQAQGNAETLAFVVMPDHFHWLFSLGPHITLERLMNSVKGYSAKEINLVLQRTNPKSRRSVWQRGYHDHALRKDEEIIETARYIVANPLRAGLVDKLGDYPLWDAKWL
jgi:REP element-mobilizing transposase RayT